MNKLYEKYLNWRLNKINLEIQRIQFFTHFTKPPYSNPPTPLFPVSYVKYKYNRLEELQSKRKQLTTKLNPSLICEAN